MKTSEIIQIGREIIYLAGNYKHYTINQASKIEKQLHKYKAQLASSNNKYTEKLYIFIDDLLDDLKNNRPLQIDELFEDDYIGNYYLTKKQVQYYNTLFPASMYQKIVKNPEESESIIETQIQVFKENFKKINLDFISSALLIFTLFDIQSPKPHLKRLYQLSSQYNLSKKSRNLVKYMLREYNILLEAIKKYGIKNIKTGNIHSKYIQVEKGKLDNFTFNLQDAAKSENRSGNILFEYKEILRRL